MTAAGWYQAEGDPPGTTRYWDGSQWIGEPVPTPPGGPGAYGAGGSGARHNLASPGVRIGARLIDFVVIGLIAIAVLFPMISDIISDIDALGPSPSEAAVERVMTDAVEDNVGRFLLVALGAAPWDVVWVAFAGGTPGKLILGLRVAAADSGKTPPGFGKAVLRALNRVVSFIPVLGGLVVVIAALASLVMLFADDQNRTVMDRIASTVVIKK